MKMVSGGSSLDRFGPEFCNLGPLHLTFMAKKNRQTPDERPFLKGRKGATDGNNPMQKLWTAV
jgi:hypothetical protein